MPLGISPCLGCLSSFPSLGRSKLLDDTLVSVLENRPANCEIIVVHTEPYDDPYDLADEVRFFKARRRAGIVECLNLALAASRAPVVHVLACGVEVSPGWADAALRHFRDPQVAEVAAMLLDPNDRQRVISAGLGNRAEGTVCRIGQGRDVIEASNDLHSLCGPDMSAAFYRKSALKAVGGFSPQAADGMAGIDVAMALRRGFRWCVGTGVRCLGGRRHGLRPIGFSTRPRRRTALLVLGLDPRLDAFPAGPRRVAHRRVRHQPLASLAGRPVGRSGLGVDPDGVQPASSTADSTSAGRRLFGNPLAALRHGGFRRGTAIGSGRVSCGWYVSCGW